MTATTDSEQNTLELQMGLLRELAEVLARHPASAENVRLIVTPSGMEMAENEVLVQRSGSDSRLLELVPVAIDNLGHDDLLFDSQLMDPGDSSFNRYANGIRAASCLTRYNIQKECVHIYN